MTHRRSLHLLLMPYALGLLLLYFVPILLALVLAFLRYDGLSAPEFIGWLNFRLILTDSLFAQSINNTLALLILPSVLRVAGAFLVAHLLWRYGRLLPVWRSFVYLPSIIPSAAFALAWLWILNPLYGPLNLTLQALGLAPSPWLASTAWAKPGVALALIWQIGEGFLVSLAVLHDLSPQWDEAARVDGAGSWGVFRYITLPLVAPILLLLLLRDGIILLQDSMTTVWLMTQGGPYYATYTLPQFIYEQAFDQLSFGTAAAALWMLYLLSGAFVFIVYLIARQWQVGLTEEHFLL